MALSLSASRTRTRKSSTLIGPDNPEKDFGWGDFDQDGDGQDAMQFGGTDCVDTNPTVYTGAAESDGDKLDVN